MLYIGIDLGTSATKLLLVNEAGEVLNEVSEAYQVSYPQPGWSEQNPSDWWLAVRVGVHRLLHGFNHHEVRGIGVGGQMHGLVALDANDQVIRPCILWNDGRTTKQVAYLNERVGRERLSALTGNIAFAGFTAPKLLWMRENEPENFARIAHILPPKDYLVHLLTGAYATDLSDASGMLLLDVEHRAWSSEMCELCGVHPEWLPALHESWEAVGTLGERAAGDLGLDANVVVAAGAGDNAAAAVGCGIVGPGRCNISLGTSGTIFITSDTFGVDAANALHSFCHADGGYHLMGCILSAASCNAWWAGDILGTSDFAAEQAGIDEAAVTPDLPYFIPYLMGERSPHNDASARGAFAGLRMDTTRAEMTRAVLEGVAFAFRDCLEIAREQGIVVERSCVCGGGSKSELWLRMLANVLDVTLELPQTEQGPGYGGAMLAMVAAGDQPSVEQAARSLVHTRGTVEPSPALVEAYTRRYEVWHELYPALRPVAARMSR